MNTASTSIPKEIKLYSHPPGKSAELLIIHTRLYTLAEVKMHPSGGKQFKRELMLLLINKLVYFISRCSFIFETNISRLKGLLMKSEHPHAKALARSVGLVYAV